MASVRAQLAQVAALSWTVRLEGPSGSGKSVAARLIHDWSLRAARPFIECDVSELDEGLVRDELQGHVRGAFTGALRDRPGRFEAAHGGTLFLDEIGTASPRVQVALRRLVEQKAVYRLGENRPRPVDVRIICATNQDLRRAVAEGRFRSDLFFRLGTLVIRMPALAEHREDIPELALHFVQRAAAQLSWEPPELAADALARLMAYGWPGNVRELEDAMRYYVAFRTLPDEITRVQPPAGLQDRVAAALARHRGNKSAVARELGISRTTLYRWLGALGA